MKGRSTMSKTRWRLVIPVALVLIALVAAACSSDGDDEESNQATTPQATSAPAAAAPTAVPATAVPTAPRVQRLVVAITPPTSEGNDPNFDFSSPPSIQVRPMYEYLVGVNGDSGAFEPQLATEWAVEPDGKSIRYKLREGVQFHNGSGEFTAQDVVFTAADIADEESLHGFSGLFRANVEEVEVVNDHEVVFRFTKPDPNLFNTIAQLIGGMEILSKADFDATGRPTLADRPTSGTGTYQFKERAQGQFIRFEQTRETHWRHTPDFRELELRWTAEASTRLAALLAGEVHITSLPTDLQAQVENEGMTVIRGPVPGRRAWISFNSGWLKDASDPSLGYEYPDSPLVDLNVRKALNKAVDRQALIDAFLGGNGEKMILNNFHPTRLGWNEEWVQRFDEEYGFDPEASRALLAEAGYGPNNPLETNLFIINLGELPGSADITEAVGGFWEEVGVNVNLITLDDAARNAGLRGRTFDNHSGIVSFPADIFLGVRVFMTSFHPVGAQYQDSEINRLYNLASSSFDPDVQSTHLKDLGEQAFNVQQNLPLFWMPTDVVANPEFVSSYGFTGDIAGVWSHLYNVKAAQ